MSDIFSKHVNQVAEKTAKHLGTSKDEQPKTHIDKHLEAVAAKRLQHLQSLKNRLNNSYSDTTQVSAQIRALTDYTQKNDQKSNSR